MNLGEKRDIIMERFDEKPFIYDGIPLKPEDKRDINLSYDSCPFCCGEVLSVKVSSDAHYWHHACGREGLLKVCLKCGRYFGFELTAMN